MSTQTINYAALGGLQPLVSDLLTKTDPKNHFLAPTYTADSQALQDRMNQYQFYNTKQLGGLANYFSPYSSATYKNQMVFKPADFTAAQSNLIGLTPDQVSSLSGALGSYGSVGSLGGQNYYSKSDINKALSGYGSLSSDKWNTYSDAIKSKFSPVANINGQLLFKPEDTSQLSNTVGMEDYLAKLNPLRTKIETWEPAIPTNSNGPGNTVLFRGTNNATPPENQGWIESPGTYDYESGVSSPSTWSRTVQDTPLTVESFWQQYGATPEGGWSDANTKRTDLSYILRRKSSTDPMQKWMSDTSFLPRFSLYGTGSPEDIQRGFNVLQRMSPQNIGEFWSLGKDVQKGMLENPAAALQFMRATANPANRDWLSVGAEGGFSGFDAYKWDPTKGMSVDPSRYMQIDDSNNGLLGSLNQALGKIDPIGHAIEGGVAGVLGFDSGLDMVRTLGEPVGNAVGYIFAGGLPLGSMVMAADNLSTGNDKALMGNVISGLTSYAGANMPTSSVAGTGYSLGSNAANAAANQAIINAAATAARGGNLNNILTSAALSSLGAYGGNALGQYTQGLSPLAKIAANAGYGSLAGGISGALRGRSFGQGAKSGALSGLTNSTIRTMLNNQLYKG